MSFRKMLLPLLAALLTQGCLTSAQKKSEERKFYKHEMVRKCLQLDQERKDSNARECWKNLLKKLQSDKAFRQASELSDADIAKIQQKVDQSNERASNLKHELDKCYKIPAPKRDERMACFNDYLKKNKNRLSVSDRFEVESSLKEMEKAGRLAAGTIENTVEHAGKLMGLGLHMEDEGIRIDSVSKDARLAGDASADLEQGIIMAIDEVLTQDMDESERIAQLEACQDRPLLLTIRKGGSDKVRFLRLQIQCSDQPNGTIVSDFTTDSRKCTDSSSVELKWGISWCFDVPDGVVEIEEVYKNSPADKAGVMPGHRYTRINGKSMLGMTPKQMLDILSNDSGKISFSSSEGALSSPAPLNGPTLSDEQALGFWKAIRISRKRAKEKK